MHFGAKHCTNLLVQMIPGDFFQLVLVDHLDGHLFAREHMPGRFDHCEMALAERLFQVVHAGDVAAIVFGRSGGFRFADYPATVLHIDVVVLGAIGRQQPAPDRAAAPCSLPDHNRTGVVAAHLVVGPQTCRPLSTYLPAGRYSRGASRRGTAFVSDGRVVRSL